MRNFIDCVIILTTCVLLTGCRQQTNYMVRNSGTETLYGVTMCLQSNSSFQHGTLIGGSGKSYSGSVEIAKVNELTLSWKDHQGTEHLKTMTVSGDALKDKRMRVFTITPAMEVEESWRWED